MIRINQVIDQDNYYRERYLNSTTNKGQKESFT